MWGKVISGAAIVLAFALAAFLGDKLLTHYGEARYQAGLADGQLKQVPAVLAANERVAKSGLDARDQVIAADGIRDAELGRLLPIIVSWKEREAVYAQSAAGRADCLGPERVLGIEDHRAALFPPPTADQAGGRAAGSVPSDAVAKASGRQPQ